MKRQLYKGIQFFLLMLFSFRNPAQSIITIQVQQGPSGRLEDPVFVAGSFNQWQPAHPGYRMQPDREGRCTMELKADRGTLLEFKFTRGSWDKVEVQADGRERPNHLLKVNGDTSVAYVVANWRDKQPAPPPAHSAGPQIRIMDTAFLLKALGVQRRIWLYLPKDYATSSRRYPVLYLQDGQNIFDAGTSAYGEWGADEILDDYFDATGQSCIVVAIDHGGETRLTDYNPYNSFMYGRGKGRLYVKSLVESLKPYIDARYRTLPDAAHTWIAGSSMGGLISMWAVMQYPDVFGGAGMLSPAFWMAPQIRSDARSLLRRYQGRLFFYAGGQEGRQMVPDMDQVINRIRQNSKATIERYVKKGAGHNEAAWKGVFPLFLRSMLE